MPSQPRLLCARLPWLFSLLIGADRAAALGRGYRATSANTTQRLHALLVTVVVSGVWSDFVFTGLGAVLVLGELEQPAYTMILGSAGWLGATGGRGRLRSHRCDILGLM